MRVVSTDGTPIAYEVAGAGPALVLVGGGLDDGAENAPLAGELARSFTVYNYARRGRGESGDTPSYAVEREVEDIAALVARAGGAAHVYGVSTGGALALEAAAGGVAIDRLAVYEVPYDMGDDWPPRWRRYVDGVGTALAAGRRGEALELFMRLAGTSDEELAGVRASPYWPGMEALAHTLAYDAACLGDGRPPADRLAAITQPTLVMTGTAGRLPGAARWARALEPAADAVAACIPDARRHTLEGQGHVADPAAVAPALERFFTA